MIHKHHIIPLHEWRNRVNPKATRTDSDFNTPENVVWLSLEQHTQAHFLLYEMNGNKYDKIAYLALSETIGKGEAHRMVASVSNIGNKNAIGTRTEEFKLQQSIRMMGHKGTKHTEEWKIEASLRAKIQMTGKKRGPYRCYIRKKRGPYRKRNV